MTTQAPIYFSTRSETQHNVSRKIGDPSHIKGCRKMVTATQPFVLLVPTYGGGHHSGARCRVR